MRNIIACVATLTAACAAPEHDASPGELAGPAILRIHIQHNNGALGVVNVDPPSHDEVLCTSDCEIVLDQNAQFDFYNIQASTPSKSTISLCTDPVRCFLDPPDSGFVDVTVTFDRDTIANEEWVALLPAELRAGAFDGSDNLVVGGTHVHKLSPTGATIWTRPIEVVALRTGPGDTVYVRGPTRLFKLAPSGAALWQVPLPAGVPTSCGFPPFNHCLAVGPSGEVAIHADTRLMRWDANGNFSWERQFDSDSNWTIAIDAQGVVSSTSESSNGDSRDLIRFAADGTPLDPIEFFCGDHHADLYLRGGAVDCIYSGHSMLVGPEVITIGGGSSVEAAAHTTGTGDVGLAFHTNQFAPTPHTNLTYRVARYNAMDQRLWMIEGGIRDLFVHFVGTYPNDIAGSPSGRLAIIGGFTSFFPEPVRGLVKTFAP